MEMCTMQITSGLYLQIRTKSQHRWACCGQEEDEEKKSHNLEVLKLESEDKLIKRGGKH